MAATPLTIIVPARISSRRISEKPLVEIQGKPLVRRMCERLHRMQFNGVAPHVIVSTDSQQVAKALQGICTVVLDAREYASGTDRVAALCAAQPDLLTGEPVVNVQCDQPFISPAAIAGAFDWVGDDADVGTAAYWITEHHGVSSSVRASDVLVGVDARNQCIGFFRQGVWLASAFEHASRSIAIAHHAGVYAYCVETLARFHHAHPTPAERGAHLEQARMMDIGLTLYAETLPGPIPVSIDIPEDVAYAQQCEDPGEASWAWETIEPPTVCAQYLEDQRS